MTNMLETDSLLCTEVLSNLVTPQKEILAHKKPVQIIEVPLTVQAEEDPAQLNDVRVLQNLLRNEDNYGLTVPDYIVNVQEKSITAEMRKIVADWMLEVVREQLSQPEVFCLAMNTLDRFLCLCKISKHQLQLVGAVSILVASKIREPCAISGKTLVALTDYSVTHREIFECELLILSRLGWEISTITPIDFLDQVFARLDIHDICDRNKLARINSIELRQRTETILVLAATEYKFAYIPPSLMAASAVLSGLLSMTRLTEQAMREVRLRLQTSTHSPTVHLNECVEAINQMLPSFLQALDVNYSEPVQITIPDSTSSPTKCASLPCSPPRTCPSPPPSLRRRSASLSPQRPHHNDSNDSYSYLMCTENLSDDSTLLEGFDNDDCVMSPITRGTFDGKETSNSPTYSATDIFTTILDPDYEQNEKLDSHLSIMVS